jgi:hypothetical protein
LEKSIEVITLSDPPVRRFGGLAERQDTSQY